MHLWHDTWLQARFFFIARNLSIANWNKERREKNENRLWIIKVEIWPNEMWNVICELNCRLNEMWYNIHFSVQSACTYMCFLLMLACSYNYAVVIFIRSFNFFILHVFEITSQVMFYMHACILLLLYCCYPLQAIKVTYNFEFHICIS